MVIWNITFLRRFEINIVNGFSEKFVKEHIFLNSIPQFHQLYRDILHSKMELICTTCPMQARFSIPCCHIFHVLVQCEIGLEVMAFKWLHWLKKKIIENENELNKLYLKRSLSK